MLEHLQWALRQRVADYEKEDALDDPRENPTFKGAAIAAHLDPKTLRDGPHCSLCSRHILPGETLKRTEDGFLCCNCADLP
jgi:hypothetical protein